MSHNRNSETGDERRPRERRASASAGASAVLGAGKYYSTTWTATTTTCEPWPLHCGRAFCGLSVPAKR